MRPLYVQRGLDRPAYLIVRSVLRIEGRTPGRIADDRERRRSRNAERLIEDGQIVLDRGAAESVDDQDRLASPINSGREVVGRPYEVRRVADDRYPAGGAIGHCLGVDGARVRLDAERIFRESRAAL